MGFFSGLLDVGKSLIGPLTGGLIDLGGKYAQNQLIGQPNANSAFAQSKEGADTAWARQRLLYRNRYQWTARDMKRAGLNPILAASGGFSVGNAPSVSSAQGYQANQPQLSGTSSALNLAQAKKEDESVGLIKNQALESMARAQQLFKDANLKRQQAIKTIKESRNLSKTEQILVRQLTNMEQEYYVKARQIEKMGTEIIEIEARTEKEQSETELVNKQKEKIGYEMELLQKQAKTLKLKLNQLKRMSELYGPYSGSVLTALSETIKALSPFGNIQR